MGDEQVDEGAAIGAKPGLKPSRGDQSWEAVRSTHARGPVPSVASSRVTNIAVSVNNATNIAGEIENAMTHAVTIDIAITRPNTIGVRR